MDMKILIEFFPIGNTDSLSNMIKQLRLGYPGGSYVMNKARVVSSFHHILAPGFGFDLSSVLNFLTTSDKL